MNYGPPRLGWDRVALRALSRRQAGHPKQGEALVSSEESRAPSLLSLPTRGVHRAPAFRPCQGNLVSRLRASRGPGCRLQIARRVNQEGFKLPALPCTPPSCRARRRSHQFGRLRVRILGRQHSPAKGHRREAAGRTRWHSMAVPASPCRLRVSCPTQRDHGGSSGLVSCIRGSCSCVRCAAISPAHLRVSTPLMHIHIQICAAPLSYDYL